MNIKENQQKVVAALRSGNYKQGMGQLCHGDCFCVWGVISDVSGLGAWEKEYDDDLHKRYVVDGITSFALPHLNVKGWVGLNEASALTIDGKRKNMIDHNDEGATFEQLADAIEQQIINNKE